MNSLIFSTEFKINDFITVHIPTVGEILEFGEEEYDSVIALLTAMPIDMMVVLDDLGIDFSILTEWELFIMLFSTLQEMNTSLVFGDLDLKKFKVFQDENEKIVLINSEEDQIITSRDKQKIADFLRKINDIPKDKRKPGNKEAKAYMLERARKKAKRHKPKFKSRLESYVVALVNTPEFKYNFKTVKDITIYQLVKSARQIQRRIQFDSLMTGIYTGNIDTEKINKEELDWITQED